MCRDVQMCVQMCAANHPVMLIREAKKRKCLSKSVSIGMGCEKRETKERGSERFTKLQFFLHRCRAGEMATKVEQTYDDSNR